MTLFMHIITSTGVISNNSDPSNKLSQTSLLCAGKMYSPAVCLHSRAIYQAPSLLPLSVCVQLLNYL